MSESRPRRSAASRRARGSSTTSPEAELIIVTHPAAGVTVGPEGLQATNADITGLRRALPRGAEIVHTFGLDPVRLRRRMDELPSGADVPDLVSYLSVVGAGGDLAGLAERILAEDPVAGAYVRPPPEPPIAPDLADAHIPGAARGAVAPATTPDFTARQIYEDASPAGIDARWAWTRPGGGGAGVRVIDVEGAWRFTHEDLLLNQGGVIGGTEIANIIWRNHGTAVAGVLSGDRNAFGITGIAPDANIRAISILFPGSGQIPARAIFFATLALSAGDIILVELHNPGPRYGFAERPDQLGYIAMEWWPDIGDAIRYATGRGVIVVEAAGNGAENLDDALYDTPAAGFPASWINSFRGGRADSGAILVGAGAPPPGTHGQDYGPDRSRLGFSNFGSRVDCQGWGQEVTTTGYGDLQWGATEDVWYTDAFNGTSSASPIVVGAVACYQGISTAAGNPKMPAEVRARLRATGSPQLDAPGRSAAQRIGNRPDLRAMLPLLEKGAIKETIKEYLKDKAELVEAKAFKDAKEFRDTKERPEKIEIEKLENAEKPEFKERKEIIEGKDWSERKDFEGSDLEHRVDVGQTEERLQFLEQAVGQLTHFITRELRPDLGAGALQYGNVYGGGQQAVDAQSENDLGDTEEPTER
jgi:hypothetical protein